jgi:hypothetical protein
MMRDRLQNLIRWAVGVTVVGVISYQLWNIGLMNVIREMPVHIGFYLVVPVLHLSLPAVEVLIYRRIWTVDLFRAFLVKKVFNEELAGYSGEVYLFTRIHEATGDDRAHIARTVRDVNILSAAVSYSVALVLLGVLLARTVIPIQALADWMSPAAWGAILVTAVGLGVVAYRYRSHLFAMPARQSLPICGLYLVRFTAHHALMVVQWSMVMPDTPWDVWLVFIAIAIVLNRIPFLPGKDWIFAWAGIGLSGYVDLAASGVAGMLLVSGALNRLMNLVLYLWAKGR